MTLETSSRIKLRQRAATLSERHRDVGAADVVQAVIQSEFAGRIGLVSSFGAEAAVLLHMVATTDPYTPVIFLDTDKHFPETLAYRDRLLVELGLCNTQLVRPTPDAVQADDPEGDLHGRNPDLCCHVRKTIPMVRALRGMDAWITGRKRGQTTLRQDLDLFETQDHWIKVNPLYLWTEEQVRDYMAWHSLPDHPLYAAGYRSIGCAPCTRAVASGEDPRAGRWTDSEKTECGIHFVDGKAVRASQTSG